ncbi:MAG: phage tail protein [Acinetobacter sp.]|nr:phage tail protein [Acinetobacter sp.]
MSDYFNVTTNVGDAAIATAIANNSKLNITHIAFGDGNGSVPTPTKTRTSLVKEVHRQAVTKYNMHPTIANYIVIETIIPSNIGGFWIREMGIIADNVLISHGSHAPFFKVVDPDGVSEYRLKFTQNIRDGNVVEISLDESLIYASQAWVNENYIRQNEVVDNLTTDDVKKPVSAKQAKNLQDNKLDKTANAVSSSKLETARTISFSGAATGSFNFDGSGNSSCVLALANSGVVASTYGAALKIPVLTVNAKGLITGVSEQNIPIVDDLITDDGNKPLSARQGKKLQDEKFSKSGGQLSGKLTTKPSYLAQNLDDIGAGDNSPIRVPGQLIPLDMTGYIPFVHGSMQTTYNGYVTQISIGGYRGSNNWENSGAYIAVGGNDTAPTEAFMFLNGRKISNTAGPIDLIGNASSANKLAIPRTLFGQPFDGSSDVRGTITASTGLIQASAFHFIDMGRSGLDRMNFYNYGATFNFIESQNGNVVARITQNGIDCNAASATRLKTPRNIALSGAVSGNANFDGSGNIDIAAVLNNFGGLKESNGYKYLGDGTLIQWVRLNKIVGQYSGEYNFPIAFPNVCFGVSISNSWYVSQSGNGYQLRAGVKSNTVFGIGEDNFNGQGVGNMSQAFVIAIGC